MCITGGLGISATGMFRTSTTNIYVSTCTSKVLYSAIPTTAWELAILKASYETFELADWPAWS